MAISNADLTKESQLIKYAEHEILFHSSNEYSISSMPFLETRIKGRNKLRILSCLDQRNVLEYVLMTILS